MTQPGVNSEQIAALFAERKRYEAWIAMLEQRRGQTPAHIYDRVRADYTGRLQRVMEMLASQRAALQEIENGLMNRLSALDVDEAKHRDEAAEAELRALVGELDADRHREIKDRTDAALATLSTERSEVAGELSRLRALLESGEPARAPAPPAAPRAPEVTGPRRAPAPAQKVDDWQLGFERTAQPQVPATPAPAPRPSGSDLRVEGPPAGPFDDLEFLKTMIEPRTSGEGVAVGSGAGVADASRAASAGASGGDAARVPAASANQPAASASAESVAPKEVGSEQVKTLRCQECGTMNYPTEWYCERCGAELAAL